MLPHAVVEGGRAARRWRWIARLNGPPFLSPGQRPGCNAREFCGLKGRYNLLTYYAPLGLEEFQIPIHPGRWPGLRDGRAFGAQGRSSPSLNLSVLDGVDEKIANWVLLIANC